MSCLRALKLFVSLWKGIQIRFLTIIGAMRRGKDAREKGREGLMNKITENHWVFHEKPSLGDIDLGPRTFACVDG
jgi:hypothetical protein